MRKLNNNTIPKAVYYWVPFFASSCGLILFKGKNLSIHICIKFNRGNFYQ